MVPYRQNFIWNDIKKTIKWNIIVFFVRRWDVSNLVFRNKPVAIKNWNSRRILLLCPILRNSHCYIISMLYEDVKRKRHRVLCRQYLYEANNGRHSSNIFIYFIRPIYSTCKQLLGRNNIIINQMGSFIDLKKLCTGENVLETPPSIIAGHDEDSIITVVSSSTSGSFNKNNNFLFRCCVQWRERSMDAKIKYFAGAGVNYM